ncbi:radical SAM protein [bacterium]|nr:radical SAM protein [bacterium]
MLPKSVSRARIGLAMWMYNLLGIRRPLTSQILVTKYCNLNCKMCFVYPLDKKEKIANTKEPTFEQLEYLIDESCKLGAQVIVPFGGEPLLRKDIGEIIKAIKQRNRYCLLYTNGTYVEEKINDLLPVDQLVISIDGDEHTNDSIRGKGVYKKAIAALELALEHGIVCRLHSCLIPETICTLEHMSALSKKYDVMINYGYCDITAFTKPAEKDISLGREDVIAFLKRYYEMKKSGVRISTPARVIKECIRIMEDWPVDNTILSKSEAKEFSKLRIPRCALASSNIYIDSDGSAYPCLPLWGKEVNPPNVYELGLRKAWNYYKKLDCHQCASIFTIEKSLFYSFDVMTLLQYISGYQFLR